MGRLHSSIKYLYDGAYVDDLVPFIASDLMESDEFVRARLQVLQRERLRRKALKRVGVLKSSSDSGSADGLK